MKRKIRCICIDGMERTGKSSIVREMRKFLKNKEKDLHEINGEDILSLDKQDTLLKDNNNSVVLKENGLLSTFHNDLKEFRGIQYISQEYSELIRREACSNHEFGVVHFFLIPENKETATRMFGEELPAWYLDLMKFYKAINQTSLVQGLDVRLIAFNEDDRIFDVRDKILEILEKEYQI